MPSRAQPFATLNASSRIRRRSASCTRLRVWFYSGIEPLAPARLIDHRSGDLLTRIVADVETLENFYIRVVVPPLAAALVTALACLILGSFDILLGLTLLVFLIVTGVGLPLASQLLSRQPAAELVATRAELNAGLVDDIQGLGDLMAYGREGDYQARLLALTAELNRLQERMAMIRGLGNGLSALLTSLAGLTILGLAIPLVTGGRIAGVYLALLPLTAIASFEAVQPLAQAMQYLEASRAAARRLFDLIDAPPPVVEPSVACAPAGAYSILKCRICVSPTRAMSHCVLDGISLSVPAGSAVALVGPSGSGKTTLANLLARFWEYAEGHIRLGGRELREYRAEDLRGAMSVVSQHTHLFNTTIRDNLSLAKADATDEEIIAACRQAQIHDFVAGLPQGYDTLVGENGLRLSGGERQRLAIARAILKDAPILILDEATAHLDPATEQQVWQALGKFMQGRTTVIISHQPAGLAYAGTVLKLEMISS